MRTTRQVRESHLEQRQADLAGDLSRNYDVDVVLFSAEGIHRGHEGVRLLAPILRTYVSAGRYSYDQLLVDGQVGMLQWTAEGDAVEIHDDADSYVVRGGCIVAQTIPYSTRPKR